MTVYACGEELRGNVVAFVCTHVFTAYEREESRGRKNIREENSNMDEQCNVCTLKWNVTVEFHGLDLKWLAMLGY